MRIKFTLLFTFLAIVSFAGNDKDLKQTYKIISDHVDTSMAAGTCLVIGMVKEGNMPVENGLIGATIGENDTTTDSAGYYQLTISDLDSVVYFYKPYYNEIVISPYDFKSQHVVVIDFYAAIKIFNEVMKKPVIYFYPEEKMSVSVALNIKGALTFTYPPIEEKWDFMVSTDGQLHKDGKSFPYLFWEGESTDIQFVRTSNPDEVKGELVKADQVVLYLESKLTALGLNDKEKTDFITFWGPILMKNETSFVQFLLDDAVTSLIGDLEILPVPQTTRRVYLLFCNANLLEEKIIAPDQLPEFNRNGFTVIEWGGTEISRKFKI